jgi:prepilin-type N-terminal cleavage/methylation domain-containing protein
MKTRISIRAGFTLIELLAVLLILSILVGVLLVSLRDSDKATRVKLAETLLAKLESAAKHYQNEHGSAPASSFVSGQEVANDGLNVGIEAFVVAMFSKKYEGGGLLADVRDQLVNTDGDRSTKQLTDFESRDLLEIPDPWGSPVAYVERTDYGQTNRRYQTYDPETGELLETVPTAFKNKATGQYFAAQGFQFISAGPDCQFGTEDDITTFQRE